MRLPRVGLLALVLCACGPSAESLERARVLAALDQLRDAPAGEVRARRKLIAALAQTPAVVPAIVRARDTCADAYRLLIDGTEMQNSVRVELDKGNPDPSLAARLLQAGSKITQSDIVMPDCERAIADLRLPRRH
jgi:hypothetical protein